MQWSFTCILLASIAIISASHHEIRSKRDLSFIKGHVLSKIFGKFKNDTTPKPANYRLFKIPGFDNILVKAVPKVPVVLEIEAPPPSVLEVTEAEPVPIHPSIKIVSKYLGTNKLNDTLYALKGMKNLLQSGVLTAKREGIDHISAYKGSLPSVAEESSKIVVDEARRPIMVYSSLGQTIMERYRPVQVSSYPNLLIPLKYSYKQGNNDGVMSYTAHDNHNVMVTADKRPVPLPASISYRINDILSMGTYRLPTSPVMHTRVKSHPVPFPMFDVPKVQVPYQTVKVMPSYTSSGYSYNQVHNDGSVTTYSGSGHVEEHEGGTRVVMTETKNPAMSEVVTVMEGKPPSIPVLHVPKVQGPLHSVKIPSDSSGYSYNHVHNDGSVTTYSGSGPVVQHGGEKSAITFTETERPTVVVSDVNEPPAPFPVFNVPKIKVPSGSGYTYNYVYDDGPETTHTTLGHAAEHQGGKPAVVITEPERPTGIVSDVVGPPAPFFGFKLNKVKVPSDSRYSYNHVHNDGSVTSYTGLGDVTGHTDRKPAVVITEPERPTVVIADVGSLAPFPAFNVPNLKMPSGSGYSYNHVHDDGSMTTYTGSGHVAEHQGKKPAVVITEPGRPNVMIADSEGPPVSISAYNVNVKVPSSSGYSYNHEHNDGSVTSYSGSGHVTGHEDRKPAVITEPGRPTVVVADVGSLAPFPAFNVPNVKVPSGSGYSYNHIYNDGFVTTYTGSGHVAELHGGKPAVVITEPGRPPVVVADAKGPPAPFPAINVSTVKVPSGSGYSYNHVHNDGSMTTYSGSGHVAEHHEGKPAVVITEPGRPTVVVADTEVSPAPFPVFRVPNVKVPSESGYSYTQVRNDGSVTSHSGSGHVVGNERGNPNVIITEPGRSTVVVSDVEGPPLPFPVFNRSKVKVPSDFGYSYNHVRNDGSVTNYSGPEHVMEHEKEHSAVVITETGRQGPSPLPVFNIPNVPFGSGFTYNHVHNDGSVTSYSGSEHLLKHEEQKPSVVMTEHGRPTVVVADVEGPPAPFPVFNVPKKKVPSSPGYSYNHVHNDGTMTLYSGTGHVKEHQGETSAEVVTEIRQPLPLPMFFTNRIENVAATEMAPRRPTSFYRPPAPAYHEQSVVVEERPDYVYHVMHNPYDMQHRPNFSEQVKVDSVKHYNEYSRPTSNVPSEFSYKTVHEDGSVTSYTDGIGKGTHEIHNRPILYSTAPAAPHINDNTDKEQVICKDPAHLHNKVTKKDHSNSSKFSYKIVSDDGSSTTYSGSGYVEHNKIYNGAHVEGSPVADGPILVTQTNDDNPQKVSLTPVLSQYMYKQGNNHNTDGFSAVYKEDVPIIDDQVNVKVSPPTVSGNSDLGSVEVSKVLSNYVLKPSSTIEEPVPTKRPVGRTSTRKAMKTISSSSEIPLAAIPTSTKISHSFKPKRVHRYRVRTPSSSSRVLKTSAPLTTTTEMPSSTIVTSLLSANPIVVLPKDNEFSFKQDRVDSTLINVVGNKENKVSVVDELKISPNRGDIPDSTF